MSTASPTTNASTPPTIPGFRGEVDSRAGGGDVKMLQSIRDNSRPGKGGCDAMFKIGPESCPAIREPVNLTCGGGRSTVTTLVYDASQAVASLVPSPLRPEVTPAAKTVSAVAGQVLQPDTATPRMQGWHGPVGIVRQINARQIMNGPATAKTAVAIGPYAQLSRRIAALPGLSPGAKLLHAILEIHVDRGTAPSNSDLAEEAGEYLPDGKPNAQQVKRWLAELREWHDGPLVVALMAMRGGRHYRVGFAYPDATSTAADGSPATHTMGHRRPTQWVASDPHNGSPANRANTRLQTDSHTATTDATVVAAIEAPDRGAETPQPAVQAPPTAAATVAPPEPPEQAERPELHVLMQECIDKLDLDACEAIEIMQEAEAGKLPDDEIRSAIADTRRAKRREEKKVPQDRLGGYLVKIIRRKIKEQTAENQKVECEKAAVPAAYRPAVMPPPTPPEDLATPEDFAAAGFAPRRPALVGRRTRA